MQYSSFLLRCWIQPEGRMAAQVEHIQSSQVLRAASLEEARTWIEKMTKEWQNHTQEEPEEQSNENGI